MNITPTSASLRKVVTAAFPVDSEFDAFCQDYFQGTFNLFTLTMDRTQKLNLLLQREDSFQIIHAIQSNYPQKFSRYAHLIEDEGNKNILREAYGSDVRSKSTAVESETIVGAQQWHEAPNFTYSDQSEKEVSLRHLRGNPVIIHFWAAWCAPSRVQVGELEKLRNDSKLNDVHILDINIDKNVDIAKLYQLNTVPITYIIDRRGIVRVVLVGVVKATKIRQELLKID